MRKERVSRVVAEGTTAARIALNDRGGSHKFCLGQMVTQGTVTQGNGGCLTKKIEKDTTETGPLTKKIEKTSLRQGQTALVTLSNRRNLRGKVCRKNLRGNAECSVKLGHLGHRKKHLWVMSDR